MWERVFSKKGKIMNEGVSEKKKWEVGDVVTDFGGSTSSCQRKGKNRGVTLVERWAVTISPVFCLPGPF